LPDAGSRAHRAASTYVNTIPLGVHSLSPCPLKLLNQLVIILPSASQKGLGGTWYTVYTSEYKEGRCGKIKIMLSIRPVSTLLVLLAVLVLGLAVPGLADTPGEEMQQFIDECNYMVETMQHCEQGWVDFEQEMIDSVNSFADRIVYTEGLIMQEADLILDMSAKIVQTEEIVFDMIESCNCSSSSSSSSVNKSSTNSNNNTSSSGATEYSTSSTDVATNTDYSASPMQQEQGHQQQQQVEILTFDRCTAMDEIIEVMDACIDTFEVFNDDFLEVLSYMDSAIQSMGDRIVDTECLIVNMSYQVSELDDDDGDGDDDREVESKRIV
jgi:hypothetical protein